MKDPCIVVTCFAKGQPGYLDFSYRIDALSKVFEVTVISSESLENYPELQVEGVKYVVIPSGTGRKAWFKYLLNVSMYVNRQYPALLVLLHSSAAPVALLVRKCIKKVVYWNEHPTHSAPRIEGFHPLKNLLRFGVRWLMFSGARKADLIMPIGEAHYADLLQHGAQKEHTHMIYMGVGDDFNKETMRGDSRKLVPPNIIRIVYVGSVSKERGRDVMLDAIALVNQGGSKAHLTIIGASNEEIHYCNRYAAHLGIAEMISVMGRISGAEIPQYLKDADIGICLWEDKEWWRFNPPTKLFEYLVAGLPVLASNIRTHTQYITNWENGLIFEYGSQYLADAIDSLYVHRSELTTMKNNSALIGKQYLWSKIEPEFMQAIESVVS
jgi:glycosyltransferase involved in cell wall biosynthesis